MVLASCRLVFSAVRHHNRLDAAAVNRIAVNTSADTARPMLTAQGLPADRGGGRPSCSRLGTAIILFRFGPECRPVRLNIHQNSGARYLVPARGTEHSGQIPAACMLRGQEHD